MNSDQFARSEKARSTLKASDWVIARALEATVINEQWCAWRDTVRRVVETGEGEIPPEPPRWLNVHAEKPEPIEIPRFLAPDPIEGIPDALLDLAEPGETVAEMQARLWKLWREMNGKLMLNIATPEEIALHTRLHNELHWIAPPIEGDE